MRGIFTFLSVFYTLLVAGQESDIPLSIRVPVKCKLIAHVYAKGVQVYICTKDPKDSSRYTWAFKEPVATLYTDGGLRQLAGKHYFDAGKSPTWEMKDGSKISGVKVQQDSPPDTTAIPWLLLKATATGGSGKLASVEYIQRIHTKGGKALAAGQSRGQVVEVPYTAEYLFYTDK